MCFRRLRLAILVAVGLTAACDDIETVQLKEMPAGAAIAAQPIPAETAQTGAPPKPFDFYVLALSWSPSYCEAEGAEANQQQCDSRRRYAFIVHGLWPQFERGYPSECMTEVPRVPDDLVRSLYDIMPSAGLIGQQWRRHGSCTGLSQEDFFATLRRARERVTIPADFRRLENPKTVTAEAVEQAFIKENHKLAGNGISTVCDKRLFREVRICLTKDLSFRACPELEKRSCRATKLVMPPVRG